jgi:nucleotide-binding universal stress UspA family protein
MFKHILVAVDGSAPANRGLDSAIDLAVDQRAILHILHVVDSTPITIGLAGEMPPVYLDALVKAFRNEGRKILTKAELVARDRGVNALPALVESRGTPVADTILRQAKKQKADLIVLGTHGRRGIRRILLGSDAETVLRKARVPVLLVRATDAAKRSPRARLVKAASGKPVPTLKRRQMAHARA